MAEYYVLYIQTNTYRRACDWCFHRAYTRYSLGRTREYTDLYVCSDCMKFLKHSADTWVEMNDCIDAESRVFTDMEYLAIWDRYFQSSRGPQAH